MSFYGVNYILYFYMRVVCKLIFLPTSVLLFLTNRSQYLAVHPATNAFSCVFVTKCKLYVLFQVSGEIICGD